ncbi:hypothetical protein AMTR_s00029p00119960 [Amborella trichopoda]|uniref:NAB domain-containing protein n=2 Tax=Amborella trichopoda TaxID=13333 RepID=W1PQK5_AMBTC|nr:hypothetical protein AMTR_s00029p00119960 [Amborella trichopoda]
MRAVLKSQAEQETFNSFAQRAETYYESRPQLVSLLYDLHQNFLSLAERFSHLKNFGEIKAENEIESDAESSISFQHSQETDQFQYHPYKSPLKVAAAPCYDTGILVTELVMATVEREIILDEMKQTNQSLKDTSKKIDLQKSLLEVLESERLVLLTENGKLAYQITAVTEENRRVISENKFLSQKATELARCVVRMRNDHTVCVLGRKMEELQGQIRNLEKQNKEHFGRLVDSGGSKPDTLRELVGSVGREPTKSRYLGKVRMFKFLGCGFGSCGCAVE